MGSEGTATNRTRGSCRSSHQEQLDDFRQQSQVPVCLTYSLKGGWSGAKMFLVEHQDLFFLVLNAMLAIFSVFLTSGLLVFPLLA